MTAEYREEIGPKVQKLREDLQGKPETNQREMPGKPVGLSLLFDDVSSR